MVMIMLTTMRMIWLAANYFDDVMRNEDDFVLWHPEWAWLHHIWGLFFAPDIWFVRSYIFWPQHIWGSYKRDFAPDVFAFWSFKRCTLQIFWLWKQFQRQCRGANLCHLQVESHKSRMVSISSSSSPLYHHQVQDGLHIMAGCSVNLADQPEVWWHFILSNRIPGCIQY